jgi:uncharacterized protein YraI
MRRAIVIAVALLLGGPISLSRQEPSLAPSRRAFATATLPLRESPSPGAPIVTVVPRGTLVALRDCDDDWCAVELRTQLGFAARRYLTVGEAVMPESSSTRLASTASTPATESTASTFARSSPGPQRTMSRTRSSALRRSSPASP